MIFSKPFLTLDEDDLKDLVEKRRVREHVQLDYKSAPYDHKHDGKVELLADVTSLANAQGGYIVIGVSEDSNEPDGTPLEIVGIDKGDEEANWLNSVCLSSIDEKIPGLQIRDVPLANGKSCVVIDVPDSPRKPHMIVNEGHRSFRMRHGRDKAFMGMREVHDMIITTNAYQQSLQDFIRARIHATANFTDARPWLILTSTPIYVDRDKINPLRNEISAILRNLPGTPDPSVTWIAPEEPLPRIFGAEATTHFNDDKSLHSVLRLFRNGHLEYAQTRFIEESVEGKPLRVYSYRLCAVLLHFLEIAKRIYELGEISEPIVVTLNLQGFTNSFLFRWRNDRGFTMAFNAKPYVWQDPVMTIQVSTSDLSNPNEVAKVIIAQLFNAYGYADNPHFDEKGSFRIWK